MPLSKPYLPVDIDDLQLAFPVNVVNDLMPAREDIPRQFRSMGATKWNQFIQDRFFSGVHDLQLDPVDGIDPEKAWRHVMAILGSWEPKHQHKEEACAYLMSLWYTDVRWKVGQI